MTRLALLVSLFIPLVVTSQTCLPEGIIFTTQLQIDNFQTDFPGCTEIEGDVRIGGDNITNLNGINVLTAIGGNLWVEDNNTLTSLAGLDSLKTIDGDLGIMDNFLKSLTGLNNLTLISGYLFISGNDSLSSLEGLGNIDNSSITDLIITYNNSLSDCAVQSICDYLVSPGGTIEIHDNAIGCNSQQLVEEICASSVDEIIDLSTTITYPNPFSTSTTIEYELTQPQTVIITFYNQCGKQVDVIEAKQQKGLNEIVWTPENLAEGIYYFRLEAGERVTSGKVVLVR